MSTALIWFGPVRYADNNGNPLVGGQLFAYAAGTSTPQTTYTDSTGGTPNTNPIILNARGEAFVWLSPTLGYKFVLEDAQGNLIWSQDNVNTTLTGTQSIIPNVTNTYNLGSPSFTWANGYFGTSVVIAGAPAVTYPQTAAESAASVTPVNLQYAPGNINRYGTNTTPGTTDMSTALTNALAVAQDVYIPAGTYALAQTTPFNLLSGQVLYGDGSLSILNLSFSATTSGILGNGITGATVRNLKLVAATGTATGYFGTVAFTGVCTNCVVEGCDISGSPMIGILLQDAVSCTVRRNYLHGFNFVTAAGDGGGIYLRGTAAGGCLYNTVTENQCFNNSWYGIAVLTGNGVAASQGLNKNNLVANNRVGQQPGYGLLQYSGNGNYDLYNQFIGNYVENIQGASVAGGSAGAGIYCVSAGAIVIANNTILNCCVTTANESLAPAGIGIAGTVAASAPVTVTGNHISGMSKYHGIDVTSCAGPVNVTGNTVLHPASNVTGSPIKVNGSSLATVNSNILSNASANQAIWCHITSITVTQNDFIGNKIISAAPGIQFDVTSGSLTQCNVSDNDISVSVAQSGIILAGIIQGVIKGNNINNGATYGITISACTRMRVSGNDVVCSSATQALQITGTCTDSFVDESNYFNATGSATTGANAVANLGTGCTVTQRGTAIPSAGTAAVGDTTVNSAPTAAGVSFWRCTTAGTNGGTAVYKTISNT